MRRSRKKPKDTKYDRDLENFIYRYVSETGDCAWTTEKVAAWAIKRELWAQEQTCAIRQLASHLSRVAGRVYIKDDDGNKVRYYHPYPPGKDQPMLWEGMDTISVENMNRSKTVKRDGIAGRVIQVVRDLDHFNKHHNPGEPLLFDSNFGPEVEEAKHPTEFKDVPPEDDQGN